MNQFDQMRDAMQEAEQTIRAADQMSSQMARMLRGRLNHVSPMVLADLKRELKRFNAHTGQWRD